MKNSLVKFLSYLLALVVGGSGVYTLGMQDGQAYNATSTTSTGAGLHLQVKTSNAVLGSIVVASSSAGTLKIWNATSTTDSASSTVASVKASVGENVFIYDVATPRGLIIEAGTGFNGFYTITYR